MKKILLMIVFIITVLPAFAQKKKNRLEAGFGGYMFYNVLGQMDIRSRKILYFTYRRQITTQLGVFASYAKAPIGAWLMTYENFTTDTASIGKIETRNKYQFFDLGMAYALLRYHSHQLSVTAGVSLAYGENAYKTKLIMAPGGIYGQGDIIDVAYEWKNESYPGLIAGLRYDYFFWKKRVNAGIDFTIREYAHDFPFQINYGIHLGYNF